MRRSNKSHKVPNVRLRPAQAVPRKPTLRDLPSADSGFDSDADASFVDSCPRPLRGVVVCATGINDKTTLFKQAIELGAQPLHDLTDRVTHLIALEPGSEKYKCALENRLPIMHPSWIAACYDIWLKGDDVDVEESVEQHRLPVFSDVVLCVSGIEDMEKRTTIHRLVAQQGGNYVKNIERPVRVTHLLCSTGLEEKTEKMKYALKFNERKEASIRLVWEQWFWDSLKVQGRCDEDAYDISKPCPVRQPTPEPAQPNAGSSSLLNDFADVSAPSAKPQEPEDEEEEMATVKRVPAVTLQIWQDLLKPRGFELQEGKLIRSPSKSQNPPRIIPDPFESPSKNKGKTRAVSPEKDDRDAAPAAKPSVIASFRRTQSFMRKPEDSSMQRRPFRRVPTTMAEPLPTETSDDGPPVASSSSGFEQRHQLFQGKVFRAMGEARCPSVREAVEQAGGMLVSEGSDEEVDFIIVRLVSGSKLFRDEPDALERAKFRTECWLERCVFEERVCAPTDHVSFLPIRVETPVNGSEQVSISFSGLDQSEACSVRRLARALGMSISPNFSRRTTHLLCPSRTGAKFDKAVEWRIPVVDMAWFATIATTGVLPDNLPDINVGAGISLKRVADAHNPHTMADITNDGAGETSPHNAQRQSSRHSSPLGDSDYVDFGQPNDLLCDLPPPHTADVNKPEADFKQPMTLEQLREDMMTTQIRSSTSPSPMKLPSRAPSKSPTKISEEATKVLQETISSLLGKRPSEEESTLPTIRPKRARPPSRIKSALKLGVPQTIQEMPDMTQSEPPTQVVPEEIALQRANSERSGMLRVTYEDPDQKTERLRLMELLEAQSHDNEAQLADDSSLVGTARSTKRRRVGTRRRGPGF